MSKLSSLADRLSELHGIEIDRDTLQRTRAGHWQRSSGAWSWWVYLARTEDQARRCVGSQYSITELLKAKNWTIGNDKWDIEIDPAIKL